ncbi:MAG TPA: hypothetical protein VEX62_08485 [Candidatus Limnocylindrales bacterium]|nr:hypothetical protein [Candidatus Limnocylindrales bacterium]
MRHSLGTDDQPEGDPEKLTEDMREEPADVPPVVPAIAVEQPGIAAGIGAAGIAKQNPEGGLTGDDESAWQRDAEDERSEPA